MKNLKFEKVSSKLTKEELSILKGGYDLKNGDTNNGDTYNNGAWGRDPNGDKNAVCWTQADSWFVCK